MAVYVGVKGSKRQVFRSAKHPTEASHGKRFGYVIGPFRTLKAAKLCKEYGRNNPHMQTVADCERIARQGSLRK